MSTILLPAYVAASFGVEQEATVLSGTEGRTYRSGQVVLRYGQGGSEALWAVHTLHALPWGDFRIERPLCAHDGAWSIDGWTAWTYLTGRSARPDDAAAVAQATRALHAALAPTPYAHHLRDTAGLADRAAWGEEPIPRSLPAPIDGPVRRLATARRPVRGLRNQVIHGDLNFHNILIDPAELPGFIDFSPYWRPPEFAAAIAAYWLGPYQGDTVALRQFSDVRELEQMLVRVALRQLLRLHQTQALEYAEEFAQAANVVCQLVS